ncbi:MAG: hypothetical protein NC203_00640 [Firmicutes bacterium]|nr:hypothetical protein [[Eubacterium] siraeum]MCM1486847.1 hypothetical protein [Bacillota bacterium]
MKIIPILTGIAFLLALTACGVQEGQCEASVKEAFSGLKLNKSTEFANRYKPYTLKDLEETCDVIVIGAYAGDTEQKESYLYDEQAERDTLVNVITYGSIEVSKVFKGDFKEGDLINVAQEYAVIDNEYITFSELTPMLEGDTWLFFLFNNYDSGIYYCLGDCDGRYPLKNTAYRRNALTEYEDLGVFEKESFNEKIYGEILEKYEF